MVRRALAGCYDYIRIHRGFESCGSRRHTISIGTRDWKKHPITYRGRGFSGLLGISDSADDYRLDRKSLCKYSDRLGAAFSDGTKFVGVVEILVKRKSLPRASVWKKVTHNCQGS